MIINDNGLVRLEAEQLVNEYESEYGWIIKVYLMSKDAKYQDGINAIAEFLNLDIESDEDMNYLYQRGNGVWDQIRWNIYDYEDKLSSKTIKRMTSSQ